MFTLNNSCNSLAQLDWRQTTVVVESGSSTTFLAMTSDAHLALDRRARTACSRMSVCARHPQRVNSRKVTPIMRADGEPALLHDVFSELHNFRLTTALTCFTREQWYVPLYSRVRELGSQLARLCSESTVRAWLCELISTKTDQSSEFAKRLRIYFRAGSSMQPACVPAEMQHGCGQLDILARRERNQRPTSHSLTRVVGAAESTARLRSTHRAMTRRSRRSAEPMPRVTLAATLWAACRS